MEVVLLVTLSVCAGGAVLVLLLRSDRQRLGAETVFLLGFLFVGAFSVLPGLGLYALQSAWFPPSPSGRWNQVLFIWTVNAPVEELSKYLCFAVTATLLRTLKEPQDGVLQGAATGLGFGLVENFLYGLGGGWELLVLRSLMSLPGHVIYGAVWGGYHGFEVYQGRGRIRRPWVPLLALVPATFAHALFNTLVLLEAPWGLAISGDVASLGLGVFLFFQLRAFSPGRRRHPLRDWRRAIPETQHALALNPHSVVLKQRLAAYYLAGDQPRLALCVLEGVADEPWTRFYRQAALRRMDPLPGPLPPESDLDPRLFQSLAGG